jgi:hypothetical protein
MGKQVIDAEVEFYFEWGYGVSIRKLRDDLDALEKLGATHVDIEARTDWDCPILSIDACNRRMETDDEYEARVDAIQAGIDRRVQEDLEMLEKLKSKYE